MISGDWRYWCVVGGYYIVSTFFYNDHVLSEKSNFYKKCSYPLNQPILFFRIYIKKIISTIEKQSCPKYYLL